LKKQQKICGILIRGYVSGVIRKLDQMKEEDKKAKVVEKKTPMVKNSQRNILPQGYTELATVPDVYSSNPTDSLVSFINVFDNDEGIDYIVGNKIKEITDGKNVLSRYGNTRAVAHFLRDADILPNQQFAPMEWPTIKGYTFRSTSPGKAISATGFDDPERYRMLYQKTGDGNRYRIKYVKNKDLTEEQIKIDVTGSVNTMKKIGEDIIKMYGIKPEDLKIIYHDMGSYSAKPKSKKGILDYKQWIDYNRYNMGFSGAPLMVPEKKIGGETKNWLNKYK